MDNAMVAMKCFHWLKKKVSDKKGVMKLKVNMSKSYDRLEWSFILETLSSMGFLASMVELINKCIAFVSYKVLVNGVPNMSFTLEKVLRQGDTISPYLFILCGDVFSGLLKRASISKQLRGIKISRKAPMITHLFFIDNK